MFAQELLPESDIAFTDHFALVSALDEALPPSELIDDVDLLAAQRAQSQENLLDFEPFPSTLVLYSSSPRISSPLNIVPTKQKPGL